MFESIPAQFNYLFWEYDPSDISLSGHKDFVIERVLEKGNKYALRWLFKQFKLIEIKFVIDNSPNISKATKNLWLHVI